MDIENVRRFSDLVANPDWLGRVHAFASTLRTRPRRAGGLLLVGTPEDEPWHLAAHLDDAARRAGLPQLTPTLIRHRVPVGAPAHLATDLSRLLHAAHDETVLVIAPTLAPADLLNRLEDARRAGATILAIQTGATELHGLAHETITVSEDLIPEERNSWRGRPAPQQLQLPSAFESAQHLVALAASEHPTGNPGRRLASRLFRASG